MSAIEVTTQAQLDKALKNLKDGDYVVCLGGTWDKPLIVRGSSSVVAWDSSRVVARGSSRVVAWDSSSVEARDSSSVEAGKYVAIHKHPRGKQKINGGVVIDVPDVTKLDARGWCDYYGVQVSRGYAVLFKCVDDDYATDHSRNAGIFYTPGAKVTAPDWKKTKACGNGLHVSPRPSAAREYHNGTKFVAVKARLADIVVIDNKVKVPALTVVGEVDQWGDACNGAAKCLTGRP